MVARAKAALIAVAFGREMVAFLMVAVTELAPMLKVVAAPPILSVVASVLKRLPVVCVVVIEPPLSAKLPALVMLPLVPFTEKLVPETSFAPKAIAVPIDASERSMAVPIPPPPEDDILTPTGRLRAAAALSTRMSSFGSAVPAPSALMNFVSPVEPVAVVTVKLESVAVSVKEKARSRLLVVAIVLPALYAAWREIDAFAHLDTLLDPLKQRTLPEVVCNPFKVKNESASVLIITELVPEGLKVALVFAVKSPLAVIAPVTVKPLLIVVVPVPAP